MRKNLYCLLMLASLSGPAHAGDDARPQYGSWGYDAAGADAAKAAYRAYVAKLLSLIDWPDAAARAKDVVDFETKIAKASWTKAQDRDVEATDNPMSIDALQKERIAIVWSHDRCHCGSL